MNFDLSEKLDALSSTLEGVTPLQGVLFIAFFLVVWFLPTLSALFLNRRHLGKIFVANFPAGISWVAWLALLAWAVTGKMRASRSQKAMEPPAG